MRFESKYDLGDRVKFWIYNNSIKFEGEIISIQFYQENEVYYIKLKNGHVHERINKEKIIEKI